MPPKRYSVERSPLTRGRYLYLVMAWFSEDSNVCVFTTRFPEAAHERKESLEGTSAKVAADRVARNCDDPASLSQASFGAVAAGERALT
ncbi:MAG TPA: hypothetical protein VGP76_13010 [Planctomycetaceae bacterium]|jgi:hypothetical protein|nr:hypothetical protein [Planctomycetaceae bacterium]